MQLLSGIEIGIVAPFLVAVLLIGLLNGRKERGAAAVWRGSEFEAPVNSRFSNTRWQAAALALAIFWRAVGIP